MLSKIEEISNVKPALKNIHYDSWIFFDLDNTVMESVLELGGDQWFSHLMRHAPSEQQAVLALYYAVQAHVRTQAVEPEIVMIIKAFQAIGLPVFALTARGPAILQPTIRQLAEIGIDFSKNQKNQMRLSQSGIICCNGQNKGDALAQFLNQCTQLPRHLVMFDDKHPHLLHVQRAVERLNIGYSGFRYGFLDEKVSQFDITKANCQLAHIHERLPLDVQAVISKLQLIPENGDTVANAADCLNGFFSSENTSATFIQNTRVSRAMSI